MSAAAAIRLGLRENWRQFSLLVLVNAFVGAMVGLERTALPLVAERDFGVASKTAALAFVAGFGAVKAVANLAAGRLSDRFGRKRVLVAGWLIGLPAPVLILSAPEWSWVVAANVLLGAQQGLCWSATVIMKIDLAGPARRGLAMGLNEAAGYLAVGAAALAAGYVDQPFHAGVAVAVVGLLASLVLVRDTHAHARYEATTEAPPPACRGALVVACQAGLVNNLNDAVAWGLFPLYFAARGLPLERIAWLAAIYPAVWGLAQIWTGRWSDRLGRRTLIAWGMVVQALGIAAIVASGRLDVWLAGAVLMGLGTAMVYPSLLAAVGDLAPAERRASVVGVYRFWRDAGYVVGALGAGGLADWLGLTWSIGAVAGLTLLSGVVVAIRMPETLRRL